ncbi:MAG: glutathione S-transferase [Phormidesmis sp.]
MKLIGMLDSPYVRRVAIALNHYDLPFEHVPLSVFRNVEEFSQINPLIKAPTLVCDNSEVLMDSTLILAYIQKLVDQQSASQPRTLMPTELEDYQQALRLIGLGLNACDKSVQLFYERNMRPEEKQYEPWLVRVQSQLLAAYQQIEAYAQSKTARSKSDGWLVANQLTHADIAVCVAWQFTHHMIPGVVPIDSCPALLKLSAKAEAEVAFASAPLGLGWMPKLPLSQR